MENQEAAKKTRQEQMMLQFERIDKFLRANSKKFYQEYDTYNTSLVDARLKLMDQAEELGKENSTIPLEIQEELRDVAEIDGIFVDLIRTN